MFSHQPRRVSSRPRRHGIGLILVALTVSLAGSALAQHPGRPGDDPIERNLFPPDLVMAHQREVGLDDTQRQRLIEEVQTLQADVVPWQFEMRGITEELAALLDGARVDEASALALAERITALEARVKHRHLTMLIRIKNLLSPEQQATLRSLRVRQGSGPG